GPADTAVQTQRPIEPTSAAQDVDFSDDEVGDGSAAGGQPRPLDRWDADDALERLKRLWHGARKPRPSGEARSTLRIALLQMNVHDVGHSFYHPVCEMTGPYRQWEAS